ncbi:MAG: NAD+ synthase [Gammaproteobacteria bacterium]
MKLRISLAQPNLLVGDIFGNAGRIVDLACVARDEQRSDAVVFPELSLTSYPPEDLLLRPETINRVERALERICSSVEGIDVILGYPRSLGGRLYNSAGVIRDGEIVAEYHKQCLPNYSVFDEKRYFDPGYNPRVIDLQGIPVGLTICEDIWEPFPAAQARAAGARLLLNLNASPFYHCKAHERETLVRQRARDNGLPIVYLNLVGGQDELVFDGGSFTIDAAGELVQRCLYFSETLVPVDFVETGGEVVPQPAEIAPAPGEDESVYRALVLGVRDYVTKNGFSGAVLGLSGGIDSALTLTIAADALGAEQIEAVLMPSRYTAGMSNEDAMAEIQALGVGHSVIPVEPAFSTFLEMLGDEFAGLPPDVTEENIQARCRGIVLMAISNKKGKVLLSTGNKSEMAVGYTTLYGDMAGGFAPIRDVPKMLVYRLARYRNSISPVIPERVLQRPPSAELAADQQDTDSLPSYEILDPILERYVEQNQSPDEIVGAGFERETVKRIIDLVDSNEYKRRQAPPGVKITRRAFGRDWRYPLTKGF